MAKPLLTVAVALAVAFSGAADAAARQRITNARVTAGPGGSLRQTVARAVESRTDAAWIGYAVPAVAGDRTMCCFDGGRTRVNGTAMSSDAAACCGMCRLEPRVPAGGATAGAAASTGAPVGPVKLEGSDTMLVLFRVADRQIERVRIFSEACELDAGGREVVWLTDVQPAESIALLESIAATTPGRRDRVADGAVAAIALHADAAADAALERLLAPGTPEAVRAEVPFWLGVARGDRGLALLQRVLRTDASIEVKKKAVFGTSRSAAPGATEVLLGLARTAAEPAVRGDAIFWLAQRAGERAAAAITDRIENDPETDVKKRAVFALSQLPKSEGVPLLIRVARTHRDAAVRKQAIFWLGQSQDPKAIEFFAEVLK